MFWKREYGPPYVPTNATPGLHPTVDQDIAPSAIFLVLYILSAIIHQVTFQVNRRKGHKFLMSWAMFGLGMARMATMVFRIAWACKPDNGSVALAATIFLFLGVLIIYIVVLLLCVRLFRARQPRLGWNKYLDRGLTAMYWILLIVVLVVVPFGIYSPYTKDPYMTKVAGWIEKAGVLYFFLFTLMAPILYFLAVFLPRPKDIEPENFGTGSMRAKIIIIGVVLFFTMFISGYRFGTAWSHYRPLDDPAWFDSRAALYIIQLGFELIITYTLIFTRFDRRFWIPNGSNKPGDYSSIDLNGTVDNIRTAFKKPQPKDRVELRDLQERKLLSSGKTDGAPSSRNKRSVEEYVSSEMSIADLSGDLESAKVDDEHH